MSMSHFVWNVSPDLVHLGPVTIRWYGALFAGGFGIGYLLVRPTFVRDKVPIDLLDQMVSWLFIGTLVGARLGHTLFYEPDVYLNDPIRILKFWEGGLASHGGVMGLALAIALFARKHRQLPFLWLADRITLGGSIAGACIRLGNLFNSEILGKPADVPWAIVFARVDQAPRHPAMLYESVVYLTLCFVLLWMYWRTQASRFPGLMLGTLITVIFGTRILIEFVKENQVDFESSLPLNMGQLLSFPFVAVGIWLIARALRSEPVDLVLTAPKKGR
jgi:phosphatidylglycerol:prolipoprotein diacylglycerol transferase